MCPRTYNYKKLLWRCCGFDEQLALGFYRLGHSVCIVTYQSDVSEDDLFGCVPIHVIHSKRKCSKWLEQEKPDLIIGSLDYPKLLDRKATSNGKVAYFLHGFLQGAIMVPSSHSWHRFIKNT